MLYSDHLIIRRLDAKDETEDVESILQYGAKAIFDDKEAEATAIRYTDEEIDELLTRSAEPATENENTAAGAFAHAKIWEKSGTLGRVAVEGEEPQDGDMHGFWAGIIDQQEAAARAARLAAQQQMARGRQRRPVSYQTDQPVMKSRRRRAGSDFSSEDDFEGGGGGRMGSDGESDDEFMLDANELREARRRRRKNGEGDDDEPQRKRRKPMNKQERGRMRRDKIERLLEHAKRFDEPELESILIRALTINMQDQSEFLGGRFSRNAFIADMDTLGCAAYWLEEATKMIRGLAEASKLASEGKLGDSNMDSPKPAATSMNGVAAPTSVKAEEQPAVAAAPLAADAANVSSLPAVKTEDSKASLVQSTLSFGSSRPPPANGAPTSKTEPEA